MEAALKLISALLLLLLFTSAGNSLRDFPLTSSVTSLCRHTDIVVEQVRTTRIVEGKPEYVVTVSNNCPCPQSKVVVQCYGLSSVEPVDPRAIRAVDGDVCVLAGGRSISRGSPVRFKYAWLTPQDFPVVSSHVNC